MLTTSFHAPGPELFENPSYTSYVQHRGSIPLHWAQDNTGVTPKPDIERESFLKLQNHQVIELTFSPSCFSKYSRSILQRRRSAFRRLIQALWSPYLCFKPNQSMHALAVIVY